MADLTRYLILMAEPEHFARWDAADEAERERVFADFRAFTAAVRERGRFRGGEALVHPRDARTLRPDGDGRRLTEGPYAETAEQLGGFYLVELPDLATALEVAALLPREYDIEVRECLDVGVPDE
ncbi:YciI family protein [Kribbella speibonae]|uniref:Transcription initiation protein n=1 Tax=Kribbella speibonae TaxID=1572660 RepID=A0A4R0JBI3_9ACTN|nr:YciI family protein [Kribbella speibonae]TCC16542.1 transcription initiation protein [Kribbella speibonae]TCC41936.1 transcription initiation protein [Kribbella speibonae]